MKDQVEIVKTLRDLRHLKQELIPNAVVRGFRHTAKRGKEAAVARTQQVFKLHSDYITRGIMFLPDKQNQIRSSIRAFKGHHHNFMASVFLRGSKKPEKGLGFMVLHEMGWKKKPQQKKVALPGHDLQRYSTKTGRGKTRDAWKPKALLSYYNRTGSNQKGSKQHGKHRRGKPKAFIFEFKSGDTGIVRRKTHKSRELQVLYRLVDDANIKKQWDFVSTIKRQVYRHLKSDVTKRLNAIRLRK